MLKSMQDFGIQLFPNKASEIFLNCPTFAFKIDSIHETEQKRS